MGCMCHRMPLQGLHNQADLAYICTVSKWKLGVVLVLGPAWLTLLKVKESSVASCQRSTVQRPYTSS